MKNSTLFSILSLMFLYNLSFSQDKILKTTIDHKNINKNSLIFNEHIQEELYKPDSVQTIYYTTDQDSTIELSKVYSYNTSGRIILIRILSIHREEFVYNEKNLLIEHKLYVKDADITYADTILPTARSVYSYDTKNRLTGKSMFSWDFDTKSWNPDTGNYEEYIYDGAGQIDHSNIYMFGLDQQRKISSVDHYSFNKTTHILSDVREQYYNFNDQWQLEDSINYQLNNDSLCTLVESYLYNSVDSFWQKTYQDEFSYDKDGKILYEVYGSNLLGSYIPFIKYIFSYNSDGKLKHIAEMNWDDGKQTWNKFFSFEYFYSEDKTTNISAIESGLKFYPNPASDILQFDGIPAGSQASVFNMNGIMLMNQSCDNGTISVSDLPKGAYILRIMNKDCIILNQVFIRK